MDIDYVVYGENSYQVFQNNKLVSQKFGDLVQNFKDGTTLIYNSNNY